MGTAPHDLHLRVLGHFEAAVDGEPVPDERWRRLQAKTLVKLLALAPGHKLHREVLVESLWPDADPALAANNLNKVIHAARRALEPGLARGVDSAFVATREHHVCLEAPAALSVDAAAFERLAERGLAERDPAALEAARELYRGDLLEEDRYDARFEPHRARLRARYRELLEALAEARRARGDLEGAAALLQTLVEREPLDERAARALMRALAELGQRDRAARVYAGLRDRLLAEIGVEPDAETRRLHEELLEEARAAGPGDAAGAAHAGAASVDPAARGPAARGPALPRRTTRFVGREAAVASVGDLIRAERLVTLTGMGGVGKTRLALEVCEAAAAAFPGGVWVVELASIEEPGLVEPAVAAALGLPPRRGGPLAEAVVAAARGARSLLLVDNCEHVAEAVAPLAAELIAAPDGPHVLATSREALGVEGETIWRVPAMRLPEPGAPVGPADLAEYEATALFLDRMRTRDPAFPLTPPRAEAIAGLCRRLDGLPLAIEIAASAASAIGLDQVLSRLDRILTLEAGARRTAPPRHRTLKAVMDWSYGLLAPEERALLRRLSVFAGGFTLEAAEGVCAGDGLPARYVPALLARLVDRSLVVANVHGEEARFGLLATVRLDAEERCAAEDDPHALRRAHARWYAAFAEQAEPELRGPGQRFAYARFDAERENLWAALRWSLSEGGEPEAGVRLAGALWLWLQRASLAEAREWLEAATAASAGAPPEARSRVLHGLGNYCQLQGDLDRAADLLEEAVALCRAGGDRGALVRPLQTLGAIRALRGEYERADAIQAEAAELCRELDDAFCLAQASFARGVLATYAASFAEARRLFEEALAGYRALEMRGNEMATAHNLAEVALLTGELDRAERLALSSLDMSRRLNERVVGPHSIRVLGDVAARRGALGEARDLLREAAELHLSQRDRIGLIHALESAAAVERASGDAEAALRALGAAEAARERYGILVHPYERAALEGCAAGAEALLDPESARAARERGRAMPLEAAVRLALVSGSTTDGTAAR